MKCPTCGYWTVEGNYCIQCGNHLPTMDYPHHVPSLYRQVATDWHGGQTSALYSVSSTGNIHDSGYRANLEGELRRAIRDNPEKGPGVGGLKAFLTWVESLPEDVDADDDT